jgi:uncharacterized membrane protein
MRLWNTLFIILVAFPLFSGGFWIRKPGLRIEFTQAGPGALILAVWLWIAWRKNPARVKNSYLVSLWIRVWAKWKQAIQCHGLKVVLPAWVVVSAIWAGSAWSKHLGFASHTFDLGLFANGFWNIATTGNSYSSVKGGITLLADHQDFLIFLQAAILKIFPSIFSLLAIQSGALAFTGVACFLLLRQRLGKESPFTAAFPLAIWFYGPLRAANLFDFHPEVVMLPLFLTAAYLIQESSWRKRSAGALVFLLALAAKESAGPIGCGFGLAWLLGAGPENTKRFTRAFGALAIIAGLAVFIFDTKVLPGMLGISYAYGDLYAPFGTSLIEIAKAPVAYPLAFAERIFGFARLKFFIVTTYPLLFLPLLGGRAVIAFLPGYLMLFLAKGDTRLSSGFHYAIEPLTGLLFALPAALLAPQIQKRKSVILALLPVVALISLGRSDFFHWRYYSVTPHQRWIRNEVLPKIPLERSVSAQGDVLPHISLRRWAHQLPNLALESGEWVDCVVWEKSVDQAPMGEKDRSQAEIILSNNFETELQCGTLRVFRRKGGQNCLQPALHCAE